MFVFNYVAFNLQAMEVPFKVFFFLFVCFAGEVNAHNRVVVLMFLKRPLFYPNAPNQYSHRWTQAHEIMFNLLKKIFFLTLPIAQL